MKRNSLLVLIMLCAFVACAPDAGPETMRIVVAADGRQRAFAYDQAVSVGQFLEQIEIPLGPLDRVNPPEFTQISDGMTITVRRVEEHEECEPRAISFDQDIIPNEGLSPGEQSLAQPGVTGLEEICYRVIIEDGVVVDRIQAGPPVTIQEPQNEVIFVGIDAGGVEPVPVFGTIAYISNGNVWLMRGSSSTKRPLTNTGALDGRVFALSADGRQLLYTQRYDDQDSEIYFNTLWAIMDTESGEPSPQQITVLSNILYADWVPNRPYTLSYSVGEATASSPGWRALNNLALMRLDPTSAATISIENIVEESSGGVYGWWGTRFRWSQDGASLAWARANGLGIVDLETGELLSLWTFPEFRTFQDWVWQPSLSWSPDNSLLVTTIHGLPFGGEEAENSPIFNIAVTTTTQGYQLEMIERAGIWAEPQFSPFVSTDEEASVGYLAYLQARDPLNSVNGQYDLVVTDRDGSNARVLFPPNNQAGLTSPEITWSPDGRQIALIYQGNLWFVDVESGRSQQLTADGGAASPRWGL